MSVLIIEGTKMTMAENMSDVVETILGDKDYSFNYMGEELRFLYEAEDQEYQLYYFRDKVSQIEFMHMIKYFLNIDNMFMLIRFVYKHSNYLLKDCLSNETDYDFEIDPVKKEQLMKRVDQLYNLDFPLE